MSDILDDLYGLVNSRKKAKVDKSYVASLFAGGNEKIGRKVCEESVETLLACVNKEGKKRIVSEAADLMFHLVVLMANNGVKPGEIFKELEKRMGISGLDEKAARKEKDKKAQSKKAKIPTKNK